MQFDANGDLRDASSNIVLFIYFIRKISKNTYANFATWELFSLLFLVASMLAACIHLSFLLSLIVAVFQLM